MNKRLRLLLLGALCVSGCATRSPDKEVPDIRDTDPMIAQLSSTARQAFEAGEISTAIVMYRRALERARAMDNSREIGRNAHNLAACLISMEDFDAASRLLAESERETARAGDEIGPVLLLAAQVARLRQEGKQAEAIIDRLERYPLSDGIKGQAYVLRAHLACDRQDASRAEGYLNRARGHLSRQQEAGLAAAVAEVAGRIAVMHGRWADAAAAFDQEAVWMQRSLRLPEMADALERAGQYYLKAGKVDVAADRFFRSARSWMAQGNYIDALQVVEQAMQFKPEDSENEETMQAIAALFEDIRRSVEEKSQAGVGVGAP